MKEFSVLMSLMDYIPVILFTTASVLLVRDLYNKMSKGSFALFAAGVIDIMTAGFLKATYKLLYALHLCDFLSLSNVFFPMQSLGFMLSGLGLFALICYRQTKEGERKNGMRKICVGVYVAIAAIVTLSLVSGIKGAGEATEDMVPYFSGTGVFVTLMILGLMLMDVSLSIIAFYMKKASLTFLFALVFISSLCMGYLSSKDFASASMNWIAEAVNTAGQASLLAAAIIMHKNDLESLSLHGGERIQ